MASANKPQTAYFLWLNANRESLTKEHGTKDLFAKAGAAWKALPAKNKKPYEDEAKQKKEEYDKYIATDEGKKALEEKKAAKADANAEKDKQAEAKAQKLAEKEQKKSAKESKAAVKAVEKDDKLKKPASAYWRWLGDNRESIVTLIKSKNPVDVAKKGGEMWKALSDIDRKPHEKKAKEQKDAYDKYIATPEGAAALKAFKDATQAAKDQFKPKEAAVAEPVEEAAVAEPVGNKRKSKEVAEPATDKGAGPKKARGRPQKATLAQAGA